MVLLVNSEGFGHLGQSVGWDESLLGHLGTEWQIYLPD